MEWLFGILVLVIVILMSAFVTKAILDLECSGGFLSKKKAQTARTVWANY